MKWRDKILPQPPEKIEIPVGGHKKNLFCRVCKCGKTRFCSRQSWVNDEDGREPQQKKIRLTPLSGCLTIFIAPAYEEQIRFEIISMWNRFSFAAQFWRWVGDSGSPMEQPRIDCLQRPEKQTICSAKHLPASSGFEWNHSECNPIYIYMYFYQTKPEL